MSSNGEIGKLSIEVLAEIFNWLEDDDLISISSVCRLWYDVVNEFVLLPKRSAILRPESPNIEPLKPLERLWLIGFYDPQFKRIENHLTNLKHLHIGYEGLTDRPFCTTVLNRILNSCENLVRLSFKNVILNDSVINVIVRNSINKLDSLTFECSSLNIDSDCVNFLKQILFLEFKLIVRKSETKANLYAQYPRPSNTLSNIILPKYITALQIDCGGLTNNSFRCLKSCTELSSVDIKHAFSMEDDAIVQYFNKLPKLTNFSISDARKISTDGWRSLFSNAQLSNISLVRCAEGLSDEVFVNAKAASKHLRLDLQNCKRLSGEGLTCAVRLTESFTLVLDYNENLLERFQNFLTHEKIPNLRFLHLSVQRRQATSNNVSTHLEEFKKNISVNLFRNHVHFTYEELLTTFRNSYISSFPMKIS